MMFPPRKRELWRQIAWICRYTSLKPDDVMEMTSYQYDAFCATLVEILQSESGEKPR